MTTFEKWTAKEAGEAIPDQNAAWLEMNLAFADGNHWQDGRAWIGPMLADGSQGYTTMQDNIKRTFVPQNAIGEIVGRHVAGVIGDSPQKARELRRPLGDDDEPTSQEEELLSEAGALLSSLWSSHQGVLTRNGRVSRVSPHEVFQEATRLTLLSRRGPLRLIVPARLLAVDEDGRTGVRPNGENAIADIISKIYIQAAAPTMATVATDKGDMSQAGIYNYKTADEQDAAEICFVDEDGRTVIRLIEGDAASVDYLLDLGGRLTMHEMERPLFVDDTKRRLQESLNLARTSESRNIVVGGFLERTYFNTQMVGEWIDDETAPGGQKFVPGKLNLGENTANILSGLPIRDESGNITNYTTPDLVYRNPTPADVFIDTTSDLYATILHEASQLHVLAQGGGGDVSGEFIVQARADFETSLKQTKTAVDAALTWYFDTVLALAAALAGKPGYFDALKISGSAIINSGPLSIGERQAIISAHEKGLISKETAVRMLGAENVSAELGRIESEHTARLQQMKVQAEILEIMNRAGVALPAAVQAVQAGEITDALIRSDFVPEGDD